MKTLRRKAFGISALGIVAVLLAGSAVAVAGTPKGKRKGVVRGVHADISVVMANGATAAFVVDRGQVTAASGGSLTLLRKDGVSLNLGLNAATTVRVDIKTGKTVTVFSSAGMAFAVLAPRRTGAVTRPGLRPGHGARATRGEAEG